MDDGGVVVVVVETMIRFLYPPGSILLPIVVDPAIAEDAFPPTRIVCAASLMDEFAPSARLVIVVCFRNCIRVFIVSNG